MFNSDNSGTGNFGFSGIFGGDATTVGNQGARWSLYLSATSRDVIWNLRNSSGGNAGSCVVAIPYGWCVISAKYDGSNFRLNVNGVTQTVAYSSGLWTPASCNYVLANGNISNNFTGGCTEPISEWWVKEASLTDTEQDALVSQLTLRLPS